MSTFNFNTEVKGEGNTFGDKGRFSVKKTTLIVDGKVIITDKEFTINIDNGKVVITTN